MPAATRASTFQRLQCQWLRARQDVSTEAIAQMEGLSVSHVRRIWSDYLRGGLAAAQGRPKGGRRHQNLTLEQEHAVLAPLQQQAQAGQLIRAHSLKVRYQARVGHTPCRTRRCIGCWPVTSGGGCPRSPSTRKTTRRPGPL